MSRNGSRYHVSAAALALGLGAVAPLGAMAQDGLTVLGADEHGTAVEMDAATLLERATEQGSIRIIVGLDTDFTPYGELNEAELRSQGERISAAQSRVMSNLSDDASVQRFRTIPFMALTVNATDLEAVLGTPGITSIQEDIPDVPHMNDTTRPNLTHAGPLWAQGSAGEGHAVVVLDTGSRPNHNSFRAPHPIGAKIVASACFSSNTSVASSLCPGGREQLVAPGRAGAGVDCDTSISGCGHGTHVAGIAVGHQGGNHGMARDADLIPMQVFSDFGGEVRSYVTDQIAALERTLIWRNEYNVASVNMSLGGGRYFGHCDDVQAARAAIIGNLRSVGIATVIASGNDGYNDSIGAPACISSAIAVGSSTKSDDVSWFSNQHTTLDLMAPGSFINAASADGPSSQLEVKSGTSMAAPHVAGGFAMLKSHDSSARVTEIERALACTGIPVTRGNQAHPRISMTRARNFLDNPDTTRGWGFGNEPQVMAWREVLGVRDRQGNSLRLRPDGDSTWSIVHAPFCVNDVVVTAQLRHVDADTSSTSWNAGLTLSSVIDDDGKNTGLWFAVGTGTSSTFVSIWEYRGQDMTVRGDTAATNLCRSSIPAIDTDAPYVLQVIKQRNDLTMRLNGQVVCTGETSAEFRNGHFGVQMAAPTGTDAEGHSLNVIRAAARPLLQRDPIFSAIAAAASSTDVTTSGSDDGVSSFGTSSTDAASMN